MTRLICKQKLLAAGSQVWLCASCLLLLQKGLTISLRCPAPCFHVTNKPVVSLHAQMARPNALSVNCPFFPLFGSGLESADPLHCTEIWYTRMSDLAFNLFKMMSYHCAHAASVNNTSTVQVDWQKGHVDLHPVFWHVIRICVDRSRRHTPHNGNVTCRRIFASTVDSRNQRN